MSQLFIWRGCVQSDDCTGPSLNLINRNVPQSNVTEPNKSNVVTVPVFGNLYEEKDTTHIVEKCPSSRLSYRLLTTFLPEKQLSPAKNFTHRVFVMNSSLGAAAPAFCVNSRQNGRDLSLCVNHHRRRIGEPRLWLLCMFSWFFFTLLMVVHSERSTVGELVNHLWC